MHNQAGLGPTRTDKTLDRIAQERASAGVDKDGLPHAESRDSTANAEACIDASAPDDERIRQAAYERYVRRGFADGHADDDWLEAERELRAASDASSAGRPR